MKNYIIPLFLIMIVSCASNVPETLHVAAEPVVLERNVSSFESECRVVKHDSKDQYRLTMYGKSYNNYWYDEEEVELLYQRFVSQGRCQ